VLWRSGNIIFFLKYGARRPNAVFEDGKFIAVVPVATPKIQKTAEKELPEELIKEMKELGVTCDVRIDESSLWIGGMINGNISSFGPLVHVKRVIESDGKLVIESDDKKTLGVLGMFHGKGLVEPKGSEVLCVIPEVPLFPLKLLPGYDRVSQYAHATLMSIDEKHAAHLRYHRFSGVRDIKPTESYESLGNCFLHQTTGRMGTFALGSISREQFILPSHYVYDVLQFFNRDLTRPGTKQVLFPGDSGCPVSTNDGLLIGLVIGGSEDYFWVVTWKFVTALWPTLDITLLPP